MEQLLKANEFLLNLTTEYVEPVLALSLRSALFYGAAAGLALLLVSLTVSYSLTARMDPKGKHVLVTGGSSGIGLAVAIKYAKLGAHITLVARNMKKLEAAKEHVLDGVDLDVTNTKVHIISLDTSSGQEAVTKKLVTEENPLGPVDILVNCAGTSIAGEFDTTDTMEFSKMFNTNVLGSVYPTRALLPQMKANKSSTRIVFVSSQVAQAALHGYTAYAASKWALRGLAEALQMEVKPHGILVSVAYPPDTDTPGYEVEMATKPDLTKKLSETGSLFTSQDVANDIVKYSGQGYFGISTGLDGWMLKQAHPGLSPVNNLWETLQLVLLSPIAKIIGIFVVLTWDLQCADTVKIDSKKAKKE
jgi:3-dehydrosphinganine reductase